MIDFTLSIAPAKIEHIPMPEFSNPFFEYKRQQILHTSNCFAFHLQNPNYPIQKLTYSEFEVIIEGAIYAENSTIKKNTELLLDKWNSPELYKEINQFQSENDGEYNIYILNKKDDKIIRFIFFNDRLGRLQTFYFTDDNRFTISRNLKLVLPYLKAKTLNTNFIADSIVFGFPIDNKTIYKEVETCGEGQIIDVIVNHVSEKILVTKKSTSIDLTSAKKFNRKEEYIENIIPLIKRSVDARITYIGADQYTCDLTGGFDSRTIFGFLTSVNNVKFTTNLILGDETKTVNQLINKFDLQDKYHIIPKENFPINEDFNKLLHYVQNFTGNEISNSICWQALESQKKLINTTFRIGGIGFTDFIRKGIRTDNNTLIQTFYSKNPYGLSIEAAIHLLQISKDDYLDHIEKTVNAWPEKNNADILKRFFYLRTLILQSRLSEDRERYHYWTIHPLWNHQLCLETLKYFPLKWRGYHIHYLLLKAIKPLLTQVEINKSYLNFNNERSIKILDFKENSIFYNKIKGMLKSENKVSSQPLSHVINVETFMQGKNTGLSHNKELDYLKASFNDMNS